MKTGPAYTVFLFQFPAFVVGTLSATAAFLGGSLSGLAFERLDAPMLALDSALQWGRTVGSLCVLVTAAAWVALFRSGQLTTVHVQRPELPIALGGVTGPVGILLGGTLGTSMACRVPITTTAIAAGARLQSVWPVVVASLAMGVAVGKMRPPQARAPIR